MHDLQAYSTDALCWLLQTPVNKKLVTDYNRYVMVEDEMWIKKINVKLTRSVYVTHQQFKEDVHQILRNAQQYNVLSPSMCAYPGGSATSLKPLSCPRASTQNSGNQRLVTYQTDAVA